YDIAISLIDGAHLPYVGTKDNEAGADLSIFLQRATGDALVFLRRAVQGSLGYYLFRAAPDADAQVRRHLENRTFYLDTTVLYSLATDEPEFRELRDDLKARRITALPSKGCSRDNPRVPEFRAVSQATRAGARANEPAHRYRGSDWQRGGQPRRFLARLLQGLGRRPVNDFGSLRPAM